MTKKAEAGVSSQEIGRWIGISGQKVRMLSDKNIVVKLGRGKYDLEQSILNYCAHLREVAAGRMGRNKEIDLVEENAKLKRAQREETELKIERLRGNLVDRAEIQPAFDTFGQIVRQHMLSMPSRARQRLSHLTGHDEKVLQEIVRDILEEASVNRIE